MSLSDLAGVRSADGAAVDKPQGFAPSSRAGHSAAVDGQAALIARRVALATAAWFNAPADVEAYRRLAAAVGVQRLRVRPQLQTSDVAELLDDLADVGPPTPLGEGVAELEAVLRRQARREL